MAVVIADHPAVVHLANEMIDVSKVVLRNFTVLGLPYFFSQPRTAPGPFQEDRFIDDLFPVRLRVGPLRHTSILTQVGHVMPHLLLAGA